VRKSSIVTFPSLSTSISFISSTVTSATRSCRRFLYPCVSRPRTAYLRTYFSSIGGLMYPDSHVSIERNAALLPILRPPWAVSTFATICGSATNGS